MEEYLWGLSPHAPVARCARRARKARDGVVCVYVPVWIFERGEIVGVLGVAGRLSDYMEVRWFGEVGRQVRFRQACKMYRSSGHIITIFRFFFFIFFFLIKPSVGDGQTASHLLPRAWLE